MTNAEKKAEAREKAREWLDKNLGKYGDIYFFPAAKKAKLDQLILKHGNTYFWYR